MDQSEGEKPKGREVDLFQARAGGKPLVANRRSVTTQNQTGPLPNGSGPVLYAAQPQPLPHLRWGRGWAVNKKQNKKEESRASPAKRNVWGRSAKKEAAAIWQRPSIL
jgi:hypothetical protein